MVMFISLLGIALVIIISIRHMESAERYFKAVRLSKRKDLWVEMPSLCNLHEAAKAWTAVSKLQTLGIDRPAL